MSFTSLMSRSYCIIWNLRHSRMYALAWKGWSSGSLLRINLREFRAVFWATLSSLILTWLLGLQSYVIDMSREYCNVYRIDGRTDVAAFLISSEYFLSLNHSPPPPLSFSLSLFLFRIFYVPSEPHAHGYARLKIWNQCDQNGCYGRAPVYRTVSVLPGAGPRRKKEIQRKVLSNNCALSPCLSRDRFITGCQWGRMHWKMKKIDRSYSILMTHRIDITV